MLGEAALWVQGDLSVSLPSLKHVPLAGQGGGARLQEFKARAGWRELGWRLLGWGEKGGDSEVGGMQRGRRGWGEWETLGLWRKEPFGNELCEKVQKGALGKGVGPQGWCGMGEGNHQGMGDASIEQRGSGMQG